MPASDIAAQYPAFAPLLQIPEIAQLLTDAANQNWSSDQLQLHLRATNWWKGTSDTQRQWQYRKLTDPAAAAQQGNQMALQILQDAATQGVPITLPQASAMADRAVGEGWDSNRTSQEVAGLATYGRDHPGVVSAQQHTLMGIAGDYGLNVSPQTTFDWAKRINEGRADQKGFEAYALEQAKLSHPYWGKQLDQGMTVRQLADPYLQTAGKLLEINPQTINLTDPKWNFTTQAKDGTRTPMSQSDWSTRLMTDPRYGWEHTDNAKQSAYQVTDQLEQTMGAK